MNNPLKTDYKYIEPYITKDGTEIRELFHPLIMGKGNISIAEARLPANSKNYLHKHAKSEEIYYCTEGEGIFILEGKEYEIRKGLTYFIPPNMEHGLKNTSNTELVVLCFSFPFYTHEDTVLS